MAVFSPAASTRRAGGTFLNWLNDRTSKVFVIATCNDYTKLPREYSLIGWDAILFVDPPALAEG